jgi:hypothetical protein
MSRLQKYWFHWVCIQIGQHIRPQKTWQYAPSHPNFSTSFLSQRPTVLQWHSSNAKSRSALFFTHHSRPLLLPQKKRPQCDHWIHFYSSHCGRPDSRVSGLLPPPSSIFKYKGEMGNLSFSEE